MKHFSRILVISVLFSFMISVGVLNGQGKYLVENKVEHSFSDPDSLDVFHIGITGKSIIEGKVIFTITDYKGNVILQESFLTHLLIGYGLIEIKNPTLNQTEKFIKTRILDFFDKSNFRIPAIGVDERFDEDYSDKAIWEDIKLDHNAIGFYYLIGEGDGRTIAYSKRMKKVVLYFNCC